MSVGSSYKNYFGSFFPSSWGARSLFAAFSFVFITGCLETGTDNSKCEPKPFNKIITPIKYQDRHDVYFSINDFDFLFTPNLVISDIDLEGVATGRHRDDDHGDDFDFDVNGTKASRCDGDRNMHWNCGGVILSDSSQTKFCTKIHKFSLNGGVPVLEFMSRVKIQRGMLRLSMHGHDEKVSNVRLVVSGSLHDKCTTPPPPPPPPPVAPKTSITAFSPVPSPTNITTKSVTFSADQVGVQFSCSRDGAASAACTSPVSFSGLLGGVHALSVFATNSAGLSDALPAQLSWMVDTQPPTVTITNAGSLPTITNVTSISVQFTSSEASTFTCSLDGALSQACTSPYSPGGLVAGTHNIVISAIDNAGNVSAFPATYQWAIDLTPPVTIINSVVPATAVNNSNQAVFQFSANESAAFACAVDNGPYQTCQSPFTVSALVEGMHWFDVRATDVAGNQGLAVSYSWKTDLTPPQIAIVSSTPAAGNSNAHNVSVDFSVNEPGTVTCSFDAAAAVDCASPFTSPVTVQGAHSLVISALDVAGNVSLDSVINWNMDFTAPILSWGVILPSAAVNKNSPNVSLEILASKSVTLFATLNGASLGQVTSPLILAGLSEGAYTVQINAVDAVGNPADALSYGFNVDLTAPLLNLNSAIIGLTTVDNNTLTFSANENSTFACNIDEAGFAACASPLALSGLADGLHDAQVLATDISGNVSTLAEVQWTVDTVAPVTTLVPGLTGINAINFTFSSSETNSTFNCSLDGAPVQACSSPLSLSSLGAGFHTFLVRAIDQAGNVDPIGASYTFDVSPPTTTLAANQTANTAITFTFTSSKAGSTFTCSFDGAAEQSCVSPMSFTGVAVGTHSFLARAKDASGNVDPVGATTSFTVRPPVTTSLLSETPEALYTSQTAMVFTFSSNQSDAHFVCSLNGAAATACTSPMTYSGLSDGVKTFKVQAVDIYGTVDALGASYSWTVDTVPPVLLTVSTSVTSTSFTVTWTTNEPSTTKLFWGISPDTSHMVPEDSVYVTSHSVHVTGLSPNTVYAFQAAGSDRASNAFVSSKFSARTGH